MRIVSAESPELVPIVHELFVEYSKSLGVDLCFQGFAEELATLPGGYSRPAGRLFLLFDEQDGEQNAVGCGALRPIDLEVCEMKRLYVQPTFRGKGAGREMIFALIDAARDIGYQRMRLDTLPSMTKAIALYRSLGFTEITAYRPNPVPGASFFELNLNRSTAST